MAADGGRRWLLAVAVAALPLGLWLLGGHAGVHAARSMLVPGAGLAEAAPVLAVGFVVLAVAATVAWLRWGTDWALVLVVVAAMAASAAWGSAEHGADTVQRAAHEFPLVIVVAAALGWARATLGGIPGFGWVAGRRVHEEHVTDLAGLPPVDRCRAVAVAALAGGVTAEHRAAVAAPDIARRSARIGLAARLRRGGDPFGSTTPRPVPPRDHRFDEPGSLTFVWSDGREFPDDHHSIIEAVHANYERSDLGFYPCEPGWSFTVCNVMGAQSMYGHDRLHGTELWDANRDSWQRTLEQEYLTPDGTYAHIRSNHVGLSWDTGEVPGGHYTANGTGRFADILPTHGARARALDLRSAGPSMAGLSAMVSDGTLDLELPEEPERHRTRSSALPGWNKIISGANLVGDGALAEAAMDGAARQCATGQRWPERPLAAGSSALGGHMIVRWSTPLGPADLNQRGYVPPVGPVLDDTAWDDVLVVLARSDDGESLDLHLEPRRGPVAALPLAFTNLEPGRAYRLECDDSTASSVEGGTVTVDLPEARSFRLVPEVVS